MNLQSRKTIEKTRFQNKIFLKFLLFTTYNLQLRKVIRIKKSFFGLKKNTERNMPIGIYN